MPDYQNSRIYKIIDLETNECYIGSTTLALSQRLAQHVVSYKRWLKGKGRNISSFKIIANDDYDIVLIELFPCNSKEELYARESHYCQSITCVNKIKNQGLLIELGRIDYNKQYSVDHKVQINNYQNTVLICQCGCSYTRHNKLRHEQANKHQEYVKNQIYYKIKIGLDMIKALDKHFSNQI
jgi:hypothetical protein